LEGDEPLNSSDFGVNIFVVSVFDPENLAQISGKKLEPELPGVGWRIGRARHLQTLEAALA